jgi:hypothetical protein
MANWELIDHNPITGLNKYLGDHPDDPDGVLVRYEQTAESIQQIIDRNKAAQLENTGPMKDELVKAAEIPIGIMYEWLVKHGVDFWNPNHKDGVKRLLNSSDYRYLKCRNIII